MPSAPGKPQDRSSSMYGTHPPPPDSSPSDSAPAWYTPRMHRRGLFDPLFHLKKPGPSRNPICLQRRGNRKTDRLRCTGRIRHHQIRHHRIQLPPGTLHGCIEGFQINAQISAVLRICFNFFQIYISTIFIIIHVHKKESPLPPVSLSLIIIHFAGQKKGRICGILNFQRY